MDYNSLEDVLLLIFNDPSREDILNLIHESQDSIIDKITAFLTNIKQYNTELYIIIDTTGFNNGIYTSICKHIDLFNHTVILYDMNEKIDHVLFGELKEASAPIHTNIKYPIYDDNMTPRKYIISPKIDSSVIVYKMFVTPRTLLLKLN